MAGRQSIPFVCGAGFLSACCRQVCKEHGRRHACRSRSFKGTSKPGGRGGDGLAPTPPVQRCETVLRIIGAEKRWRSAGCAAASPSEMQRFFRAFFGAAIGALYPFRGALLFLFAEKIPLYVGPGSFCNRNQEQGRQQQKGRTDKPPCDRNLLRHKPHERPADDLAQSVQLPAC